MKKGRTAIGAGLFLIALVITTVTYGQGPGQGQGGGPPVVNSFNGRTGNVVSISGDYSFPLISGTAAKTQLPGVTAFTDQSNSFTANQSISGNLSLAGALGISGSGNGLTIAAGNINLPRTTSASVGVITLGGRPFLHNYGTNPNNCVVGNTFVGEFAGNFFNSSTCVNGNTGIGYSALSAIQTGDSNTGLGYLALGRTTTGFSNTSIGLQSLFSNETGSNNIAVGVDALELNTDGYNNIAIGIGAGAVTNSGHNHDNIYIGHGVGAVENSTIRIGSNQTQTFVAGINGVTTGLVGVPVVVDANGQLGSCCTSSRRFKYDINDMEHATDKLLKLRPVTFRYKQAQTDGSHPVQYGLIAEEVADVYPELVQFDPKTHEPNAVLYNVLPAMLLNEFQKEHKQIEEQQQQIESLQGQLQQLAEQTRELQTELVALKGRSERDKKVALAAPLK